MIEPAPDTDSATALAAANARRWRGSKHCGEGADLGQETLYLGLAIEGQRKVAHTVYLGHFLEGVFPDSLGHALERMNVHDSVDGIVLNGSACCSH